MKTLTLVMAHAEAQQTVERHTPIWLSEGSTLMFTCPQDSMIRHYLPVVGIGRRCHHGPDSIWRFRHILEFMLQTNFDWYILHEYDSLILESVPGILTFTSEDKLHERLFCNLFTADQPQFKGHFFTHPPLSMSRKVLERIVAQFERMSDTDEQSFWDRYLGYLCERFQIEMKNYLNGFARNTIEPHDLSAAAEARKAGACFFHGVKGEAALKAITST